MALELEAIQGNQEDNMGGITAIIFYALWDDIMSFPKLPKFADITKLAGANILTGIPVMKDKKQFWPLEVTLDKGSLEDDGQGETGGMSHKHQLKFNVDSMDATIQGFMRVSNNAKMTFIVPDLDTGLYRALGMSSWRWAKKTATKGTTGEGSAGKKGAEFTFTSAGSGPCPSLKLTDAELQELIAA